MGILLEPLRNLNWRGMSHLCVLDVERYDNDISRYTTKSLPALRALYHDITNMASLSSMVVISNYAVDSHCTIVA